MNALNQAIKAVNDITVANYVWTKSIDWKVAGDDVWSERWARLASQTVEIIAPNGDKVQVTSLIASGNVTSHCRNNFKVNGKRAKAEQVVKMF